MTTPDPITTAREALERLTRNDYSSGPSGMILREEDPETIAAALDLAEKLKAERDEALTAHEDRGFDCERLRQDNTRLTSQLEQAERVIEPFARVASIWPAPVPGFQQIGHVNVTVDHCRAASQWIKDRQAKTDGEAS